MAIICKKISVKYAEISVLQEVNFKASAGNITAIIGPNGSGKSTLLKAISGDIPFSGLIKINGENISKLKAYELAWMRAVLPQSSSLAFPFTVGEVVRLGLTSTSADRNKTEMKNIQLEALEKVGLLGIENRLYQKLSGGEKQRVQLARILAQVWHPIYNGTPRWLLLDEPISSLDIAHQLLIMNLAREFARSGGGVVVVMHDLNLSAMYADWIYLIHANRVLISGNPDKVISDASLSEAYSCKVQTRKKPESSIPWVLPHQASLNKKIV